MKKPAGREPGGLAGSLDRIKSREFRECLRTVGNVPEQNNTPTPADVGICRKDVHEARITGRNALGASPRRARSNATAQASEELQACQMIISVFLRRTSRCDVIEPWHTPCTQIFAGDFRAQFDTATPPSDHTPLERRCALCVAAVEFAVPSEGALLRFRLALAPAARRERHLVRDFFSSTHSPSGPAPPDGDFRLYRSG